jgi:flagellar M-ring protein FliF
MEGVNSIRSLVANAVEGLKIDDVVVVDNGGNVLSAELQQDSVGAGLSTGQMRYRKGLEEYFSRKVESMLSTVLGTGRAVVRVSVDVDATSSTTTQESFNPDGQVLRSSTVTEDSNVSSERRDGTAVGVTANTPAPDDAGGDDPVNSSQQIRKSKTEEYEIGRSTVSTVRNAGEIRRITAAVFVGARATGEGEARTVQPRTPEEIESLRQVVVAALGVVPERGQSMEQVVTVQEVDMAPGPELIADGAIGTDLPLTTWFNLGQKVLVLLFALFAFFYFVRLLKRSQAEAISLEVINGRDGNRGVGELAGDVTPELLNELIRQKPDNVGLTLKEWMSAEQR